MDLGKIRAFILMLRARGVPIAQASYDRFQSADSLQILNKEGIPSKVISVDKDPEAYFALRGAIDEQRIRFYRYPPFINEITTVQFDPIRKSITDPADPRTAPTRSPAPCSRPSPTPKLALRCRRWAPRWTECYRAMIPGGSWATTLTQIS